MLSLTKKSDAQPIEAPLWHTNFRDFEKLPDTKVVRTTFFINTAAIALAIVMLFWLGTREFSNHSLKEQISQTKREIETNRKQNAEALRLSKVFMDEQKKVEEAIAFVNRPITPLDFIKVIGDTLPKEISLDYADIRLGDPKNSIFQIRGRVAGSPDLASGITSNYVDMLRADVNLNKVFDPITLNRVDRDPAGGFMLFEISLTIKK